MWNNYSILSFEAAAKEKGVQTVVIDPENNMERAVAAMGRSLRLRRPDQQAADRMAAVKRIEEPAHLVAVPDVPTLKLGQRHVPAVDVVEDRGDLHTRQVLPVSSSCLTASMWPRAARPTMLISPPPAWNWSRTASP